MAPQLRAVLAGFQKDAWPSLMCPYCSAAALAAEWTEVRPTEKSRSDQAHDSWEPDWIEGSFVTRLRCASSSCKEATLVIGEMRVKPVMHGLSWHGEYDEFLTPRYFYPSLRVPATLPPKVPPGVVDLLEKAVAVIWQDPNAAANRLRAAIEAILDQKRVRKTVPKTNGGRRSLSTHGRIKEFGEAQPAAGQLLEAVKWIGNEGSHSEKLTGEDVLEAMEILVHALLLLYDDRPRAVARRAAEINRRRGLGTR
jgi:hypothetical protein